MGFAPRLYEVHLWMQDEDNNWGWKPKGGVYPNQVEASVWYTRYKEGGYTGVRIVETKIVKEWSNAKEYS